MSMRQRRPMGPYILLTCTGMIAVLTLLKLSGEITWPWGYATAPFWIGAALSVAASACARRQADKDKRHDR